MHDVNLLSKEAIFLFVRYSLWLFVINTVASVCIASLPNLLLVVMIIIDV